MHLNFEKSPYLFNRYSSQNRPNTELAGSTFREDWETDYPMAGCVLNHTDPLTIISAAQKNGIAFNFEQFLHAMQWDPMTPFVVDFNGGRVKYSNFLEVVGVLNRLHALTHPFPKLNQKQSRISQ